MNTKKKVFAGNWSGFSPKLAELSLFRLIIHRWNLDGGTPKSRWRDANSRWGDAYPYNLSTGWGAEGKKIMRLYFPPEGQDKSGRLRSRWIQQTIYSTSLFDSHITLTLVTIPTNWGMGRGLRPCSCRDSPSSEPAWAATRMSPTNHNRVTKVSEPTIDRPRRMNHWTFKVAVVLRTTRFFPGQYEATAHRAICGRSHFDPTQGEQQELHHHAGQVAAIRPINTRHLPISRNTGACCSLGIRTTGSMGAPVSENVGKPRIQDRPAMPQILLQSDR